MKMHYLPRKSYILKLDLKSDEAKERMLNALNADYGTKGVFRNPVGHVACEFPGESEFIIKEVFFPGRGVVKITATGRFVDGSKGSVMSILYSITNGYVEVTFVYAWVALASYFWLKGVWLNISSGAFLNAFGALIAGAIFPIGALLLMQFFYRSYITRLHKKVLSSLR